MTRGTLKALVSISKTGGADKTRQGTDRRKISWRWRESEREQVVVKERLQRQMEEDKCILIVISFQNKFWSTH